MKWISYGWSVITGLITVAIAYAVVNAFDTRFERVVVDLLVMVFVTVQSATQTQGFIGIEQSKAARSRFFALMKAMGDRQFESEDNKELIADEDERVDRSMIKGYIHAGFNLLVYIIALLNLIYAL